MRKGRMIILSCIRCFWARNRGQSMPGLVKNGLGISGHFYVRWKRWFFHIGQVNGFNRLVRACLVRQVFVVRVVAFIRWAVLKTVLATGSQTNARGGGNSGPRFPFLLAYAPFVAIRQSRGASWNKTGVFPRWYGLGCRCWPLFRFWKPNVGGWKCGLLWCKCRVGGRHRRMRLSKNRFASFRKGFNPGQSCFF